MKKILLCFLFLCFLPYLLVSFFLPIPFESNFEFESNQVVRVRREKAGNIEEVPLEEYVLGVLAGEMPVSFELEALKAQAVAARSYVMKKMEYNQNDDYDILDTPQNQMYISTSELKDLWGSDFQKKYSKLYQAVTETSGEYLTYDGKLIESFYFSTSSGMTENSGEVFQTQLPYLVSVKSEWDQDVSPVFCENITFSLYDFYTKLNIPYQDQLEVSVQKMTSTGRIKEILINDILFTGNEVAYDLDLRSSYFSIKQEGNEVLIQTKGYGHGVGMSQYGAQGMAMKGYHYDEILTYYYQGVEIKK